MIIELLLSAIYNVMNLLMVIEIPSLPNDVLTYINQFFDYLVSGASILANYTPLAYLLTLFGLLVAVDVGIAVYHFVMWIIRKIPMLSMS